MALAAPAPRFPPGAVWHEDIRDAALHPDSAAMIATLDQLGGWGIGPSDNDILFIDFRLAVNFADPGFPPRLPVVPHHATGIYQLPDCEPPGTRIPLPVDALFERDNSFSEFDPYDDLHCANENDPCRLSVVYRGVLHELYRGDRNAGDVDAMCLVRWDLTRLYPPEGRGEGCRSADDSGFPIAPLIPSADAVAAALAVSDGDLGHVIRIRLSAARIASLPDGPDEGSERDAVYVRPATHAGEPTGPQESVPWGARLRLRADFPVTDHNPAEQVILRTMQRYGVVVAESGAPALSFASDSNNTAKWQALGVTSFGFMQRAVRVRARDFAVIDTGPRIPDTGTCVRSALVAQGFEVFYDGLE